MASVLPPQALIQQRKYGMRRMGDTLTPIAAILNLCMRWRGHLMASALPLQALRRCGCGMQLTEDIPTSIVDMMSMCMRWRGHLMASALPLQAMERCGCGMQLTEDIPTSIVDMMAMCLPWRGHLMASALPPGALTARCRCGRQQRAPCYELCGDTHPPSVL